MILASLVHLALDPFDLLAIGPFGPWSLTLLAFGHFGPRCLAYFGLLTCLLLVRRHLDLLAIVLWLFLLLDLDHLGLLDLGPWPLDPFDHWPCWPLLPLALFIHVCCWPFWPF